MRRDARNIIGVDVGGTNVKLALLTHEGETRYMRGFETRSYRPVDAVMADLAAAVRELAARAASDGVAVHALGLALPATLEPKKRQTLVMPNFAGGWYAFPVADALEGATGLPVSLVNDARAFVLAESRLGAGRGVADLFGVVLGTGVGGGVVLGGRLHLGAGGLAGEFGHHVVEPRGLRCGCGGRGCLETVASAPALVAAVTRPFLHGRSPLLHDLVGGDLNAVTAQTVSEAARLGDEACLDALERVGGALGLATANVVTLLAPERIVFGGGLSKAHDLLFPALRAAWRRHAHVAGDRLPSLELAALEEAGVLGAALYAADSEYSLERSQNA